MIVLQSKTHLNLFFQLSFRIYNTKVEQCIGSYNSLLVNGDYDFVPKSSPKYEGNHSRRGKVETYLCVGKAHQLPM